MSSWNSVRADSVAVLEFERLPFAEAQAQERALFASLRIAGRSRHPRIPPMTSADLIR